MEIKVLGPGCAKCKETEKLVRCRLLSLTTTYPVDIPYYRE